MKLLYAGFDTVDIAFQGALPSATIDQLKAARERAGERREAVLERIGPAKVPLLVQESGQTGGYAFRVDTGPTGEIIAFKANPDPREWNIFAKLRASTLASLGYHAARDQLARRFADMGCLVTGHSVNRMDYAMDFLAPGLCLALDRFVAHPRTKVRPYWGPVEGVLDAGKPAAVIRGRKLESVTIGKMPGRQVIVYDKRRAAIDQRKPFWFKAWDLDPRDKSVEVWRVETRAGKKELKDRWRISTFQEADTSIGDVFRAALDDVRYVADQQTDTNVTRQRLHPLWDAAIDHIETGMGQFRSGLLPAQVREIERQLAIETYTGLALGNLIGLAVASGMDGEEINAQLPMVAESVVRAAAANEPEKFRRSAARVRERMHFVTAGLCPRPLQANLE